jgi:hypothetical protein
MIKATPSAKRIPNGSMPTMPMYATTNGMNVPRSPNAPAYSMRSKRLRVRSAGRVPEWVLLEHALKPEASSYPVGEYLS